MRSREREKSTECVCCESLRLCVSIYRLHDSPATKTVKAMSCGSEPVHYLTYFKCHLFIQGAGKGKGYGERC